MTTYSGPLWYRLNPDGTTEATDQVVLQPIEDRRIAETFVEQGERRLRVSTVFLSLDHQHLGGPPLLFETMVFEGDRFVDEFCDRYSTIEAARAGHERVVVALRERPGPS